MQIPNLHLATSLTERVQFKIILAVYPPDFCRFKIMTSTVIFVFWLCGEFLAVLPASCTFSTAFVISAFKASVSSADTGAATGTTVKTHVTHDQHLQSEFFNQGSTNVFYLRHLHIMSLRPNLHLPGNNFHRCLKWHFFDTELYFTLSKFSFLK